MTTLRDALPELPDAIFVDLLEDEDAYLLIVDLPGATSETTTVRTTDGRIHIEARREKDLPTGYTYLREDRDVFIDVDLPLPSDVGGADATASLERGVMELRLPKTTADAGTTIPIEDA